MKKFARLLLLGLGFGLLLLLLSRLDISSVLAALRHVGWLGFGLVVRAAWR
jgi:hypothetical protein